MANNQQLLLGEGAGGGIPNFIEEVFSTYLYTGNGTTQTITNGIDLSTKGGLIWFKARDTGTSHNLIDSVRGINKYVRSDTTSAEATNGAGYGIASFNTTGFSLDPPWTSSTNTTSTNYVSWTFRKQPKFFDVVTYTGTSYSVAQTLSHNLNCEVGMIILKCTSATSRWYVYHRSAWLTDNGYNLLALNETAAAIYNNIEFGQFKPTSTQFKVNDEMNAPGATFVAYLFAHDAGGFGLAGTDNVISCGSYVGNGSATGPSINLGWEPQWLLSKVATTVTTQNWLITDTARGFTVSTDNDPQLFANLSDAEGFANRFNPNATGFDVVSANSEVNSSGETYIYIAIRRGPMKVPTVGTSVLNAITRSGNGAATTVTGVGFAPDLVFEAARTNSGGNNWIWFDRLRGGAAGLSSDNTGAEFTNSAVIQSDSLSTTMDGFRIQTANPINASGNTYVYYPLKRAPGFFDEVCYTGTGSATTVTHNLGVAPEIIIVKKRSGATYWPVRYSSAASSGYGMYLNDTGVEQNTVSVWTTTAPTSAVFSIGASGDSNASAATYVAYLFATCAGVSKVGSYTGNGSSQTIACGFTAGSRFVLIKRTDSTGDWYVWDSARGIVAGNDPHLSLNTTAADVTTDDSVDTDNSGFIVNQLAATNVNVTSATYIFLAIA